jgi:hypothetical protein
MARHTKQSIENILLSGHPISWQEPNGNLSKLALDTPAKRRLFQVLWKNPFLDSKGLSQEFIKSLWDAYNDTSDPATQMLAQRTEAISLESSWRLQRIETENFGGLNVYGGTQFSYEFDTESLIIEGSNGSGKSSLIGALAWAFTGRRLRDHSDDRADRNEPVLDQMDKIIGNWPPVTCYPPTRADIAVVPTTRVKVYLKSPDGEEATIERKLVNGELQEIRSPNLVIADVFIETGLMMPLRLSQINIKDGGGQLTDAVKKLTGLDEVSALGLLSGDLNHGAKEYLRYSKNQGIEEQQRKFQAAAVETKRLLATVNINLLPYVAADTIEESGPVATLEKSVVSKAGDLTAALAEDLLSTIDLGEPKIQRDLQNALQKAKDVLSNGLKNSETWNAIQSISTHVGSADIHNLQKAIEDAKEGLLKAKALDEALQVDNKYQLKAVGAAWHEKHHQGAVEACPLCDLSLTSQRWLVDELEQLRNAGDAAQRNLSDNVNALNSALLASIPKPILERNTFLSGLKPRLAILTELKEKLVNASAPAAYLTKFIGLTAQAINSAPNEDIECKALSSTSLQQDTDILQGSLILAENGIAVIQWLVTYQAGWQSWWIKHCGSNSEQLASSNSTNTILTQGAELAMETFVAHISRLESTILSAEPYRLAADQLRIFITAGREIVRIQTEQDRRVLVSDALAPLKSLTALAESTARQAINELSGRIQNLLKEFHLSERLHFHSTSLPKKGGVVVRAGFTDEIRIDAALIANTSWFRSTLWAFVFALREEAVEQNKGDPFPVLIFDDPQSTFDNEHRLRWAQYIASLQIQTSRIQVVLATHDPSFVATVAAAQIKGRNALIAAATVALGHIAIFEGGALERAWTTAFASKTPKDCQIYLSDVRVYLEGMLKIMLQAEDPSVGTQVVGDMRETISQLHNKRIAPWSRISFQNLANALKKQPETKFFEGAHHTTGQMYGFAEATDLQKHWHKTLGPLLTRCFLQIREHQLRHGSASRLLLSPATVELPEGYQSALRSHRLQILGRASALSDGRISDGAVVYAEIDPVGSPQHVLGKHLAYRLSAQTLEPVATQGDLLLVKELGTPAPKSLVIAIAEDRILARRFDLSDTDGDVAVLTAQAMDPLRIASPVVAHLGSLKLHKIIGVLFDEYQPRPVGHADEIISCGSESAISALLPAAIGLVEVVGQSAQPLALDGQFLVLLPSVSTVAELTRLDGKPVIAMDTDGAHFFKRLRLVSSTMVILESLDAGGLHPPHVLAISDGSAALSLKKVWPVCGVIFETS